MLRCRPWNLCAAILAVVLSSTLVPPCALAADQIDNPRYGAWARYKVGSSHTLAGVMNMGQFQMKMEMKQTLTELADDKATVETVVTMNMMGQPRTMPPRKEMVAAKINKTEAKELGEETVQAMGKSFKCKVLLVPNEAPAGPDGKTTKGEAKIYVAPEVPGGMVKMTYDTTDPDGQKITMNYVLSAYEVK